MSEPAGEEATAEVIELPDVGVVRATAEVTEVRVDDATLPVPKITSECFAQGPRYPDESHEKKRNVNIVIGGR